jgi:5-methylcytosine-specific restriction protein A
VVKEAESMIRTALDYVGRNFMSAKSEPFKDHLVAIYLRESAPLAVRTVIANPNFIVEGSPGQGKWADVPWIAIFDPTVTVSATRGYYPVYLFSANMQQVFLCLGQGTTSIREEFGRERHNELRRLAALMRARLHYAPARFSPDPVQLHGSTGLAEDYEPAIACDLGGLPDESDLQTDLHEMMRVYSKLIARGGREIFEDNISEDEEAPDSGTIEERRRYRRHRRIERAPGAAKRAKKVHG